MLTPEQWHEKNHRVSHRKGVAPWSSFEDCYACMRNKAKCGGKITYGTWAEAYTSSLEINAERGWVSDNLVTGYRCRWCLEYHLTSHVHLSRRKRLEKKRRRALWKD